MTREPKVVRAAFDDDTVIVYQAYSDAIADEALRLGTFGQAFSLGRMTWVKPSFGWMLYRSGYGRKPGQERVLRISLTHDGFRAALAAAVTPLAHAIAAGERPPVPDERPYPLDRATLRTLGCSEDAPAL